FLIFTSEHEGARPLQPLLNPTAEIIENGTLQRVDIPNYTDVRGHYSIHTARPPLRRPHPAGDRWQNSASRSQYSAPRVPATPVAHQIAAPGAAARRRALPRVPP